MIRIGKESTKSPEQVLDKAQEYFGPGGLGLEVRDRDACHISLEGGGGFVTVETCGAEGHTEVDVSSREWEQDARRFIGRL